MMPRLLLPAAIAACLPACKLATAPFRVVGVVAEGGAELGKSAYRASTKPFEKTAEEKAEEAKKKAAKAEEKAAEEKAKRAAETRRHADATRAQAEPPPADDVLPPLPDDAPLPYDGEPSGF